MIQTLKDALESTGYAFAHHAWAADAKERRQDHGTYAEDGANSIWAEGHMAEQTGMAVVDYYTRDDSGAPKRAIEAALNSAELSWYLDFVQFEPDAGWIHYVWAVEYPEEAAGNG